VLDNKNVIPDTYFFVVVTTSTFKNNGQAGFYVATFIILCFLKTRKGPADIFVITLTPEENLTDGLSPVAGLNLSWMDKVIDISRTLLPPVSSVLELSPRV